MPEKSGRYSKGKTIDGLVNRRLDSGKAGK